MSFAPTTSQHSTSSHGQTTSEQRTLGMLAHLLGLCGIVIPFVGNILGPLILYLVKKDQSAFVADQAKESLNFQITVSIVAAVCFVLMFVIIGIFLLPLLALVDLIFMILAALQAYNGVAYRYPFALRLVK
jgi:uncharacterized protein